MLGATRLLPISQQFEPLEVLGDVFVQALALLE